MKKKANSLAWDPFLNWDRWVQGFPSPQSRDSSKPGDIGFALIGFPAIESVNVLAPLKARLQYGPFLYS